MINCSFALQSNLISAFSETTSVIKLYLSSPYSCHGLLKSAQFQSFHFNFLSSHAKKRNAAIKIQSYFKMMILRDLIAEERKNVLTIQKC